MSFVFIASLQDLGNRHWIIECARVKNMRSSIWPSGMVTFKSFILFLHLSTKSTCTCSVTSTILTIATFILNSEYIYVPWHPALSLLLELHLVVSCYPAHAQTHCRCSCMCCIRVSYTQWQMWRTSTTGWPNVWMSIHFFRGWPRRSWWVNSLIHFACSQLAWASLHAAHCNVMPEVLPTDSAFPGPLASVLLGHEKYLKGCGKGYCRSLDSIQKNYLFFAEGKIIVSV